MSDYLKGKRVVDPVLTNVARGYKNAAFIGDQLFPVVQMEKEGAKASTFGKEVFAVYDTKRAIGADNNIMIREQHESMFNEEAKAARRATNGIELRREIYAAEMAQNPKIHLANAVKKLGKDDS